MALNLDAIGKPIGPIQKDYTWKDAILYSLGIGAGFSELEYCYEKELKIVPSFAIALIFDFFFKAATASGVNLMGILHGEQELIFHAPIPPEGTMTTTGKIVDLYDKGKKLQEAGTTRRDTLHNDGLWVRHTLINIMIQAEAIDPPR